MPLFTQVRGETVWKSGIGPESELRRRPRGAEEPLTAASCGLSSAIETASALFQTVSEGVFSEVPGQSRGPCACEGGGYSVRSTGEGAYLGVHLGEGRDQLLDVTVLHVGRFHPGPLRARQQRVAAISG